MKADINWFRPKWPTPANVRSVITTRESGYSKGSFAAGNLASHVGDQAACVQKNRDVLAAQMQVKQWCWLEQIHGVDSLDLDVHSPSDELPCADGSYTSMVNKACVVLTADCLPVLICDQRGSQVGVVHAGWRGLSKGIVTRAINSFIAPADQLLVYLGPAISSKYFEVGKDVVEAFQVYLGPAAESYFDKVTSMEEKFLADLYGLVKWELTQLGVKQIFGGEYCTFGESRFFSYRRDGETGRMASAIWLQEP